MYNSGKGISTNFIKAYAWYLLAEENGNKSAKSIRIDLEQELISEDIAEAENEAFRIFQKINKEK